MNRKLLQICLLGLALLSIACISHAQEARSRWDFKDYYPRNYFLDYNSENQEYNDCIGEAIFYMRLAGITPIRDLHLDNNDTILRLNYFPHFAHPLFIQVTNHNGHAFLTWQKAKSTCGYVEHTTYLESNGTDWVDVTENEYYGNVWTSGILDSGARQMLPIEWQIIRKFLVDNDFPHATRAEHCTGFETPFLLEYRDLRRQNAQYTQCYFFNNREVYFTRWLISLVAPDYVDMDIHQDAHYSKDETGFIPPQFPGGTDSIQRFISRSVVYPAEALRNVEEYKVNLELVIEKDGTIGLIHDRSHPTDKYGFVDEVAKVVKPMPRWEPAVKNGKKIRCYTSILYPFVLPDSLRPTYGHPILETHRDSARWHNIEQCHHQLVCNPKDAQAMLWMGKYYYWDFVLEHAPSETLTRYDSMYYESDWKSFYDHTPVVANPGDSALKYFYQAWQLSKDTSTQLFLYMPLLQLEYCLHLPHNPLVRLPYDTVPGVHFPHSYFVNWPEDNIWDAGTDYYTTLNQIDTWESFRWTEYLSQYLTEMGEPVLWDYPLQPGEAVYRCSFFPSFDPAVSFRIIQNGKNATLYWEQLIPNYKKDTKYTYSLKKGKKSIQLSEYKIFTSLIDTLNQANLPHSFWIEMTDGARWVYESKTSEDYKAHLTNWPSDKIRKLYYWLTDKSGLDIPYMRRY